MGWFTATYFAHNIFLGGGMMNEGNSTSVYEFSIID
jgi:hypothetical protein